MPDAHRVSHDNVETLSHDNVETVYYDEVNLYTVCIAKCMEILKPNFKFKHKFVNEW